MTRFTKHDIVRIRRNLVPNRREPSLNLDLWELSNPIISDRANT